MAGCFVTFEAGSPADASFRCHFRIIAIRWVKVPLNPNGIVLSSGRRRLRRVLFLRSVEKQIELILEKHGLVSFIVHPDYLASHDAKNINKELLKHLRGLCSDRNLWFALPREIDRWWRLRTQMRLCNKGGLWSIIGEGAERAQLAFAFESEGRLVYQLASSNLRPDYDPYEPVRYLYLLKCSH